MARPGTARLQASYDIGRRGDQPPEWVAREGQLLDAYDEGLADADRAEHGGEAISPPRQRPSARPPQNDQAPAAADPASTVRPSGVPLGGDDTQNAAGFLMGLLAYAVAVNFIRGGRAQVRGWLAAKFLNRTTPAIQQSQLLTAEHRSGMVNV